MEVIMDYLNQFLTLIAEMAPYLLLGFFFAGLLHVFMSNARMVKFMGGNNLRSVVNASLLGVPLPLCSCGVIPTGLSFSKNGASKGAAVSFLISTPQTGVDSILATYSLLGLPFAILRPFIAFVTGIFGGALTNRLIRDEIADGQSNGAEEKVIKGNKFKAIFHYAFVEFLQDISNWLIIGLIVAALISVLVPDNFFTAYIRNEYLSMLIVLLIAVPVYVCATGSIPIAAVLMMKGISPGAALVFLMAGPATNVATITMIGKVMGRKALTGYLLSIIAGALFFGILINNFLPREWFTSFSIHATHHHHETLPSWINIGSAILLGGLLVNGYLQKYLGKKGTSQINTLDTRMETKTVKVEGMTCNHCKANVERNLMGLPGVKEAVADLQSNSVRIVAENLDLPRIKSTVESIGYTYSGEL